MKNIFLLYIPPGNIEAQVHYQDTIKQKVDPERIFHFVDSNLKYSLKTIFGDKKIAVWGSRDGSKNRSGFEKMNPGDDILIVEGNKIRLLGKIAAKTDNPQLSKELWKNIKGGTSEGWNLIYFIANPLEINLPFVEFNKLFSYAPLYQIHGFTNVSEDNLKLFYSKYDDLYSVLQSIKQGNRIEEIKDVIQEQRTRAEEIDIQDIKTDEILSNEEISDHITMQWKLARLGIKAGSKVWVPRNDQQKIISNFQFNNFEKEFASGIDTDAKYVENIDVIWKEEFRIDAAFEIENSTTIYSGLLRFSDLKIVAPNSLYPLFVVAPSSKRNRLIEQMKRPSFRKLEMKNKVHFLPYETINEIDKFFQASSSGLNVDVLLGRSEPID
jgi:hypothetical protein